MTTQPTSAPLADGRRAPDTDATEHLRAIERLGYTLRAARFLANVACAGGYFLRRHFATAHGLARGGNDAAFIERLLARRHVTRYGFCRAEHVFHLSAGAFYPDQSAGRGRATRPRPALTIARRLMALDAILSRPSCQFVCGQAARVALCERAGIASADLPTRDYRPGGAPARVSRVLPDLPLLGCDTTPAPALTLVAGCVAEPAETSAGFETFLSAHSRLFAAGTSWRVLYICQSALQADRARRSFDRAMSADIQSGATRLKALAREYCALRRIYDAQQWDQLDTTKIHRLFALKQRFGADADGIYGAWLNDGGADLDGASPQLSASAPTRFEPLVLAHRYTALAAVRGLR